MTGISTFQFASTGMLLQKAQHFATIEFASVSNTVNDFRELTKLSSRFSHVFQKELSLQISLLKLSKENNCNFI